MENEYMIIEYKGKKHKADTRTVSQMDDVAYDRRWVKKVDGSKILYYMHRELEKYGNARYDITIIPAGTMGSEYVKTYGHYHPKQYSELYEVLGGEAHFIFQKGIEKLEDIIIIYAKKGDVVLVPPGYGHVTINPSAKDALWMANWVSDDFKSDYGEYKKHGGAAVFETKTGFVMNPLYENTPTPRIEKPSKIFKKGIKNLPSEGFDMSFLSDPKKALELI